MPQDTLGKRLYKIRTEQKLSMRSVASMAGVSVAYLSKIEHDEANPTLDILEKLAKALAVSLNDLTNSAEESMDLLLDMPESLKLFIEKNKDNAEYKDYLTDPDMQKILKGVRLRGKYPEKEEDWLMIFLNIRRALQ
jgi:transcriptional regulator with XRE-family HTH domain